MLIGFAVERALLRGLRRFDCEQMRYNARARQFIIILIIQIVGVDNHALPFIFALFLKPQRQLQGDACVGAEEVHELWIGIHRFVL